MRDLVHKMTVNTALSIVPCSTSRWACALSIVFVPSLKISVWDLKHSAGWGI
jgi:hypothetical protein